VCVFVHVSLGGVSLSGSTCVQLSLPLCLVSSSPPSNLLRFSFTVIHLSLFPPRLPPPPRSHVGFLQRCRSRQFCFPPSSSGNRISRGASLFHCGVGKNVQVPEGTAAFKLLVLSARWIMNTKRSISCHLCATKYFKAQSIINLMYLE